MTTPIAPTTAVPILNANSGSHHQPMIAPSETRASSAWSPSPVAQVLQSAVPSTPYSETISGINGTSPYTFTVTAGSLPTGTGLNSSTGIISGTPTAAGTFNFTIKITDANGATGTQAFEIIVVSPKGGNICVVY